MERIHETRGRGCCNVPDCPNDAMYVNPDSKFKYCQEHYDKLGGKVVLDSHSQPPRFTRLVKWKE